MAQFEFEGKTVYYETHGSGDPILLLNGIMMSTKSWSPFIENFSRRNQLILLDFIDQGQSGSADAPYDHSTQIALVSALLDKLALNSLNIAGISYGAEIALGFAQTFPGKVRRLALFNGAARTSPLLGETGNSWNEAAKAEGGLAYYLAVIPSIYSDTFYENHEDWMKARKKLLVDFFADTTVKDRLTRLTNSSKSFNVVDKLGALNMPVLIVSADKDFLTPLGEQQLMASAIKNAHHVTLNGCGHASMYEQPLLFSSLVLGFINSAQAEFSL